MKRRGFLAAILALGAAPAIVRADALMRIVPRETVLLTGELGRYENVTFVEGGPWAMEDFDFGYETGVCLTLPNGKRHACRFSNRYPGQRDPRLVQEAQQRLIEWARHGDRPQ